MTTEGNGPQAPAGEAPSPDNGCYKSHAPCGFGFGGRALVAVLSEEEAAPDA